MNNVKESNTLPSIQLIENRGWKTVELNGEEIDIPKEWYRESIQNLFDVSMGVTILSKDTKPQHFPGAIPVYSATEKNVVFGYVFESVIPSNKKLNAGDMVLGARGSLGFPKIVLEKSTSTQTTIQLKSKNTCNSGFVFHSLNSKNKQLFGGAGSGVPMLTVRDVAQTEICLPPLPEQTLIAQVLTAQESQVHDLRKLAQAERQRLTWLSDELLSGRLRVEEDPTAESVVVSRNEKGDPAEVLPGVKVVENRGWKTVEVNERETNIPDSWAAARLGGLFRFVNGSAFKPSDWGQNGMKIVRIQNLSNLDAEYNYTTKKPDDVVTIDNDDILMSWSGTIDIFRWTGDLAALNQHIFRVDVKSGTDKNFAVVLLKNTIHYLRSQAHGATMVHIRKGVVEEAECLVPPIPEQTLIAQVLTAQETQVSEIERLADLEQQRFEWLSNELLSGRIRVKTTKED